MEKLRPPLIKNKYAVALPTVIKYLERTDTGSIPREFVLDMWTELVQHDAISAHSLAENLNISVAGVRKRLDKLADVGVLERTQVKNESVRRPVNEYAFFCVDQESDRNQLPILTSDMSQVSVSSSNHQFGTQTFRIDDFFLTSLFSALDYRIRRTPSPVVHTRINIFNAWVDLEVRAEQETIVASLQDLRFLIVIYSICYDMLREKKVSGELPQNNFLIDIEIINRYLGRANSGGNITTALNALERLSNTTFMLKRLPLFLRERYKFEGNQKVQFMANFGQYSSPKNLDKQKTFVIFQLPHFIYLGMLAGDFFFVVNPLLARDDNPAMFALHLYCRRVIGHRTITFDTTLKDLHINIAAQLKYEAFESQFLNGIVQLFDKQKGDSQENMDKLEFDTSERLTYAEIDVYGYILMYRQNSSNGGDIMINTNPLDPYVGLESKHRKIVKKSQQEFDFDSSIQR